MGNSQGGGTFLGNFRDAMDTDRTTLFGYLLGMIHEIGSSSSHPMTNIIHDHTT